MIDEKLEAAAQGHRQQAASGLAAGDLSCQLIEPFAPDFKALRHELNVAVKQMDQVNQQNAVMVEEA
jgi:methyl-accepting chemotaxis protein